MYLFIFILLLFVIGLSLLLFMVTMNVRIKLPVEKLLTKEELDAFKENIAVVNSFPQKIIKLRSFDGLELVGHYLEVDKPTKLIIMCHGWRSRWNSDASKLATYLHENHCNLLMIEQRAQGNSEGKYVTFGIKESRDIKQWYDYMVSLNLDLDIYLYGTSMGAASVLMASNQDYQGKLKGIISDSGFYSVYDQLIDFGHRNLHLTTFPFAFLYELYARIFLGVSLKQINALDSLKQCKVPVLLVHGTKDNFVHYSICKIIYDSIDTDKRMEIFEGAGHCGSFMKDPDRYIKILNEFFLECEK